MTRRELAERDETELGNTRQDKTGRDKTFGGSRNIATGIDKMRLHVISPDLTQLDKTRRFNWWLAEYLDMKRQDRTRPDAARQDFSAGGLRNSRARLDGTRSGETLRNTT